MNYNAFISYRHTEPDMYVAKQVHKRLETFKVPKSVAKKTGKRKIQRVFRDQEELPIGSDLGDNITRALENSEWLIVICSPQTPQSYWVQTEIETFIRLHGRDRILAVLVEGEPAEAFPKQLLTDDKGKPVEPLAADVRGKSRSEITRRLRSEIVRLAAPLLGCSYDELKQRHRERRMRKIIGATAVTAILAVAFGVYSVYNYLTIQKNYEGKLINQSKYLADTALSLLEKGDRITAGLISLEALPTDGQNRPVVTAAQFALSQTLYAYENGSELVKDRLLKHDLPVDSILYCKDGSRLVTLDQTGNVYVWNTEDGTLIIKIMPKLEESGNIENVLGAMVTQNDTLVIITPNEVRGLDMKGDKLWSIFPKESYTGCVIKAEKEIIAGISDNIIDIINAEDGSIIQTADNLSDDSFYSTDAVFNAECNMLAVAQYSFEEQDYGEICVFNIDTGKCIIAETEYHHIMGLCFTSDDNLVAVSRDDKKLTDYAEGTITVCLEKISSSDGEVIWDNKIQINKIDIVSDSLEVKCRKYTDKMTETEHSEIVMNLNNAVYVFGSQIGDKVSEIGVSGEIANVLLSTESGLGYIAEADGVVNLYNLTTGVQYVDASVEIDRNVTDVIVNNGVLAAVIYASPDVILMKYHEGYGMETVVEFNQIVYGMDYSEDESCYVIEAGGALAELGYYFYDTENNELLAEWSIDAGEYAIDAFFVSNSVYATLTNSGKVFLYNVDNGTTECIEPSAEVMGLNWVVSDNRRFAMAYDYDTYYLVDLKKQIITAEGKVNSFINCGVISNDGKKFYGNGMENTIFCVDIDSGRISYVDDAYSISFGDPSRKTMALTSDGRYLAVSCVDNILRVWDTEYKKTVAEVSYAGQNNSFLKFMPDNNNLIMQGDTYYLRVYDLAEEEFVFISDEQYNLIEEMIADSTTNTVALVTTLEMLILNDEDFEPLAYVKNGLAYMPENGYVFNESGAMVYRFPYMDLDMLIEEAKRQFKGNELTEWERTQYNID